ncbi:hypothetical protein [Desulfosporosinus fructosivorans]
MIYDGLVSELAEKGVEVLEYRFCSRALKELYVDNVIVINCQGIATGIEKACILAEEYGHYRTTYGIFWTKKTYPTSSKKKGLELGV